MNKMYRCVVMEKADAIEKQMKRYIKMMTTVDAEVYVELEKRGFDIDLISGGNGKVLILILRK